MVWLGRDRETGGRTTGNFVCLFLFFMVVWWLVVWGKWMTRRGGKIFGYVWSLDAFGL